MIRKKKHGKNGLSFGGEIMKALMSNAQKTKEEVEKYLVNIDPKKLMDHLVDTYDIDLHAKISFKKKQPKQLDKTKKSK
ncbi:MAG: hypothetical protein A2381_06390 [Bdellovibrionales bacterium RIFOXYB1_FULL_37_110]|nr:MAG: hypothetical protein A2181_08410 [Bdellovibrionales bacterium RIFOXYA1_FULL_38_20]OFZ50170.1 MAG: hypothetical protein A2417_19240 [Bdellovibrionales bacterium RIFOXYC1_FULL_37_79]OFZ57607.1 MAG: hypothetical protein A2381_06390 [Bdellovibrionales bacterium RIFOXYB1_FULL_37_110]OFZ61325.1 MAG: hypothetical protein A2328_05900 [Bdellovibrionales bacterium RIFOXYB2_FULL_36_6]OFZ61374.1 MAG: hypothetical protein A2577_00755 [Bdellovibrionales bacterium RIFOXYD1_FULL_36_51]OFZ72877.1 MAG: 